MDAINFNWSGVTTEERRRTRENWAGLEKWPHSTLGEGGGAKHIFLQIAKLFFRAGNSVGRRRHSEVTVPTALARRNYL